MFLSEVLLSLPINLLKMLSCMKRSHSELCTWFAYALGRNHRPCQKNPAKLLGWLAAEADRFLQDC